MHPPTRPAQPPPVEPGGLSEREATIFRDLVRSVDSAHFVESDLPLLTSACHIGKPRQVEPPLVEELSMVRQRRI